MLYSGKYEGYNRTTWR